MRAMRIFLGFSAATALVGSVAAGCGSSSSPAAPQDSGPGDVTMEAMPQMEAAAPETGPDVVEAASDGACVPDAMLSTLPVPDAALGEAGATAASCLSCFETSCPMIVSMCNQSCACVDAFEQFGTCIAAGQLPVTQCAFSSFANVPGITITQLACALGCATPSICGYTIPTGGDGGEGGTTEGGGGEGGDDSGGG